MGGRQIGLRLSCGGLGRIKLAALCVGSGLQLLDGRSRGLAVGSSDFQIGPRHHRIAKKPQFAASLLQHFRKLGGGLRSFTRGRSGLVQLPAQLGRFGSGLCSRSRLRFKSVLPVVLAGELPFERLASRFGLRHRRDQSQTLRMRRGELLFGGPLLGFERSDLLPQLGVLRAGVRSRARHGFLRLGQRRR